MTELPRDDKARQQALDCSQSFIVQAPAGSGKTELLGQRYLALLARVESPEQILAITFTRKAAAEMRRRILGALQRAQDRPEAPQATHQRRTWRLARAALQHDQHQQWQLLRNPNRLRIQTIDSLCASLVRQIPLLSQLGGGLSPTDDAWPLLQEAARQTLALLEDDMLGEPIAQLLTHLGNRQSTLEDMLCGLLARRDQWIDRLLADDQRIARQQLQSALQHWISDQLTELRALMPAALQTQWTALARFAASNPRDKSNQALDPWCDGRDSYPDTRAESIAHWQGLACLVLTSNGSLRKPAGIKKGLGFPAGSPEKEQLIDLLGELTDHPCLDALHRTRAYPAAAYRDDQWQLLDALLRCLKLALAQLRLVFQQRGQSDFIEIALAARHALGNDESPTPLAMKLDYQLQHILIDEFQDTSSGQFQLLQRLIAEWQPADGRSLFLVGDPMQSIYRFREAEVGLYLQARRHGIGNIRLTPLTLSVNFRSQAGIVDWVNQQFRQLFPANEDIAAGAVCYSPSEAHHTALPGPAVQVHPQLERDEEAEAATVIDIIRQQRADDPTAHIAILVRGRTHLKAIIAALKANGLRYQAEDIDALSKHPAVQDLHTLTRVLLHPADRIAWLALLRAPWFGLTLDDLTLFGEQPSAVVWQQLQQASLRERLSAHARQRVERLLPVLAAQLAQRERSPLSTRVMALWRAVGGSALYAHAADNEACSAYMQLLLKHEQAGTLADAEAFEQALTKLYAPSDPDGDERLKLMTLHKSKGLEFDCVILPGLGHPPRRDDPQLLRWAERTPGQGQPELLLAPVARFDDEKDPTYQALGQLERNKARHEVARLLYVAATRARRRLHLLGHAKTGKDGNPRPASDSLLAALWPAIGRHWPAQDEQNAGTTIAPPRRPRQLYRLPADWQAGVEAPLGQAVSPPVLHEAEQIEFDWAGDSARSIGVLVHHWLQRIAEDGLDRWDCSRVASIRPLLQRQLRNDGVRDEQLPRALELTEQALGRALSDPRGRWILGPQAESHCELALTEATARGYQVRVIDRSFVDPDGRRWIIDYKTGGHEGADVESFLDREKLRYRDQLQDYARLFAALESRPIMLGLYFPLLAGWREWPAPD